MGGLPRTAHIRLRGRLPRGVDEVMKLLATDAPGLVHGRAHSQAAEEFPAAWTDLSKTLGIGADVPAGLVGGSMGATIASEVLARGTSGATGAALVSPLLQLHPMIDAVSPQFGGYDWTAAALPRPSGSTTRRERATRSSARRSRAVVGICPNRRCGSAPGGPRQGRLAHGWVSVWGR
jgi:alpha-beta hydrolase superfamily lysophospholipase